jgi:ribosomal protein L16/L10AE
MGKGKGPIVNWLQVVYPGSVLLEINLISGSNLIVKKALKSVQCKLGFKSKVIVQ